MASTILTNSPKLIFSEELSAKGGTVFLTDEKEPKMLVIPVDPPVFRVGDKVCYSVYPNVAWEVVSLIIEKDPGEVYHDWRHNASIRLTGENWYWHYEIARAIARDSREQAISYSPECIKVEQLELVQNQVNRAIYLPGVFPVEVWYSDQTQFYQKQFFNNNPKLW